LGVFVVQLDIRAPVRELRHHSSSGGVEKGGEMFSAAEGRGGEISTLVLLLISLDTEQKGLADLDLSGRRQWKGRRRRRATKQWRSRSKVEREDEHMLKHIESEDKEL
jgi:hypothetical protein